MTLTIVKVGEHLELRITTKYLTSVNNGAKYFISDSRYFLGA